MNLYNALQEWFIDGTWNISSTKSLANNLIFFVSNPNKGSFVLKIYLHHKDSTYINFEHNLVTLLGQKHLSFSIPAPVLNQKGDTLAKVRIEDKEALVSLWPFVSGKAWQGTNLVQTFAAGKALAELDEALKSVEIKETQSIKAPPAYGDFGKFHYLVPDPIIALQNLKLPETITSQSIDLLKGLSSMLPELYSSLPKQITHNDFDSSNVLIEQNQIRGVLDFEFSTFDLRVIDLVVALHAVGAPLLNTGKEWEAMKVLFNGYSSILSLETVEIEALPFVFKLRAATTLIYKLGRYLQGFETIDDINQRVMRTLILSQWVDGNQSKLLKLV